MTPSNLTLRDLLDEVRCFILDGHDLSDAARLIAGAPGEARVIASHSTLTTPSRSMAVSAASSRTLFSHSSTCKSLSDIEEENMIRLLVGGRGYAIYRLPNDELLCTDELYTHAQVDLSRGFVTDV